jgi:plastocyanin
MRRRLLATAAGLLAIALVAFPAAAGSETSAPSIVAENIGGGIYGETHQWSPSSATVAEGGAVTLRNPTAVAHGVHWVYGPATPACSGVPVGTTASDSGKEWNGTCTFTQAGTYTFYCTVHGPEMTGTITVDANGTVSAPPAPSTPAPPAGSSSGPASGGEGGSAAPLGSPLLGSAAAALKLSSSQHGQSVRGSVGVSRAGANGLLEVDVFAKGASLAGAGHARLVRVGRLVRASIRPGTVPFSVPLSASARSALKRSRRLALTVKIVLRPTGAGAVTVMRSVTLHA